MHCPFSHTEHLAQSSLLVQVTCGVGAALGALGTGSAQARVRRPIRSIFLIKLQILLFGFEDAQV